MEDNWNNVELSNISRRKSYTLNHEFDSNEKYTYNNNVNETSPQTKAAKEELSNGAATIVCAVANSTNDSSNILKPGSDIKPKVTVENVECILRRLYGITIGEMKELISYDDKNYFIKEDA